MKKSLDEIYEMMNSKRNQTSVEGRILGFLLNNPYILRPRKLSAKSNVFPHIFEAILMHINVIKAISVFRQYNWTEYPIIGTINNRIQNPFLMRLLDVPIFKMFDKVCALYAKQIAVNWSRVCEYNLMKSILSNRKRRRTDEENEIIFSSKWNCKKLEPLSRIQKLV